MVALAAAVIAFSALAWLLLVWARQDYERDGRPTWRSAIAAWMLYLFHADTVATAAFADVGRLSVGRAPFLALGIAVGMIGLALFVGAVVALVRRGGFDGLVASRLVTDGAFGISRHPQNLGWTLILLGFAIGSRSVIGLLLVALFALFARRYAELEERHLNTRFGDAYVEYTRAVPSVARVPLARVT